MGEYVGEQAIILGTIIVDVVYPCRLGVSPTTPVRACQAMPSFGLPRFQPQPPTLNPLFAYPRLEALLHLAFLRA